MQTTRKDVIALVLVLSVLLGLACFGLYLIFSGPSVTPP